MATKLHRLVQNVKKNEFAPDGTAVSLTQRQPCECISVKIALIFPPPPPPGDLHKSENIFQFVSRYHFSLYELRELHLATFLGICADLYVSRAQTYIFSITCKLYRS